VERRQRTTPHAHTPLNLLAARQRTHERDGRRRMRNEEDTLVPDPDFAVAYDYTYAFTFTFHPRYQRPQELLAARVQLGHGLASARHEVRRFPPRVNVRSVCIHVRVRVYGGGGGGLGPREILL